MSVNATCGKCDETLVNDNLELDNGSKIKVTGQQALNLIKPYCFSRIYRQIKRLFL